MVGVVGSNPIAPTSFSLKTGEALSSAINKHVE